MKIFGLYCNQEVGEDRFAHFLMADSALTKNNKPFFLPPWDDCFTCQAHIAVRICRLGKGIPERFAHRYWDAITIGIDFTARQMLDKARREGLPWTIAKGFDGSVVTGEWTDKRQDDFCLMINGQTVQQGSTGLLPMSIDSQISSLSRYFTMKTGDILFAGTPSEGTQVHIGDHIEAFIGEQKSVDFYVR